MLSILATLKVLFLAVTVLSPALIKETSEAVGAGVAIVELNLNHATGEEKKQASIKLINESLDVVFIKFPVSESQKNFIENVFIPNAVDGIVFLFNKLGVFQKKPLEGDPNFIGPVPDPKVS